MPYAQFAAKRQVDLNGVPVSGMIRAVKEDKSSTPMRWMVTVTPAGSIKKRLIKPRRLLLLRQFRQGPPALGAWQSYLGYAGRNGI